MKHETLWKSLTDIREEYIEEAAPDQTIAPRKKSIRRRVIGWSALAASLLLVVGIGGYALTGPHYEERYYMDFVKITPSLARIYTFSLPLEGESMQMQYPEIEWGGESYWLIYPDNEDITLPDDLLGERLGEVTATVHTVSDFTKSAAVTASIHAIEGIDPTYAVAVGIEGVDGYAIYQTERTRSSTLEDLIEKCAYREMLAVDGAVTYKTANLFGVEKLYAYEGLSSDAFWKELLEGGEMVEYGRNDSDAILYIPIRHELLRYSFTLCVTEDGYITFYALESGKAVYVGEEKAKDFLRYLHQNCTGYELVEEEPKENNANRNENTATVTWTNAKYNTHNPE